MQSRRITAEMALLLACCRWPVAPAIVGDCASVAMDWAQVLVLARRHRVQALVHNALRIAGAMVPAQIAAALADDARRVATSNLRLAAESLRIVRLLEAVGLSALIVKGTPLAKLAYGSLSLKMAWDIDLLVLPQELCRAGDVLEAAGYVCVLPGPDRDELEAWHTYSKESVWRHRDTAIHVELHTALVDSPLVLQELDARAARQRVEITPGIAVPTLARDELFAYLCVHGAASGWRRAKWLADVGALIGAVPPAEIARLYDRALQLGAGRAPALALLLCREHLGVALPPAVSQALRRDLMSRLLASLAGRMMTAPNGFDAPSETATGTLPIHLMQTMVLPGWRFTWGELRRKMVPDPRIGAKLGKVERGIYPIIALVRRLRRQSLTE